MRESRVCGIRSLGKETHDRSGVWRPHAPPWRAEGVIVGRKGLGAGELSASCQWGGTAGHGGAPGRRAGTPASSLNISGGPQGTPREATRQGTPLPDSCQGPPGASTASGCSCRRHGGPGRPSVSCSPGCPEGWAPHPRRCGKGGRHADSLHPITRAGTPTGAGGGAKFSEKTLENHSECGQTPPRYWGRRRCKSLKYRWRTVTYTTRDTLSLSSSLQNGNCAGTEARYSTSLIITIHPLFSNAGRKSGPEVEYTRAPRWWTVAWPAGQGLSGEKLQERRETDTAFSTWMERSQGEDLIPQGSGCHKTPAVEGTSSNILEATSESTLAIGSSTTRVVTWWSREPSSEGWRTCISLMKRTSHPRT